MRNRSPAKLPSKRILPQMFTKAKINIHLFQGVFALTGMAAYLGSFDLKSAGVDKALPWHDKLICMRPTEIRSPSNAIADCRYNSLIMSANLLYGSPVTARIAGGKMKRLRLADFPNCCQSLKETRGAFTYAISRWCMKNERMLVLVKKY